MLLLVVELDVEFEDVVFFVEFEVELDVEFEVVFVELVTKELQVVVIPV